jgi:hypothetical protein
MSLKAASDETDLSGEPQLGRQGAIQQDTLDISTLGQEQERIFLEIVTVSFLAMSTVWSFYLDFEGTSF